MTLKDATEECWPEDWWEYELEGLGPQPYLPDFATDFAAAVVLAEKLGASVHFEPQYGRVVVYLAEPADEFGSSAYGEGPTIGAALLAALEATS